MKIATMQATETKNKRLLSPLHCDDSNGLRSLIKMQWYVFSSGIYLVTRLELSPAGFFEAGIDQRKHFSS